VSRRWILWNSASHGLKRGWQPKRIAAPSSRLGAATNPHDLALRSPVRVPHRNHDFARTDGDIFLLRDFSILLMMLAVIFLALKLQNAFLISSIIGFTYFSIYGYIVKHHSRYLLIIYLAKHLNMIILHPVLAKLPWNNR
jgi:hypothetical protein